MRCMHPPRVDPRRVEVDDIFKLKRKMKMMHVALDVV